MCKYFLELIGFNAAESEDYYDNNYYVRTKLSIISLTYINWKISNIAWLSLI